VVTRHDSHLKFLFVRGYSVKKKSAAYVLPERAELKSRFTAASLHSRRAASIGAPRYTELGKALQGALRTNEWPNSRGNKEFVRALNTMVSRVARASPAAAGVLKCLLLFLLTVLTSRTRAAWQFYFAEGVPYTGPFLRISRAEKSDCNGSWRNIPSCSSPGLPFLIKTPSASPALAGEICL